MAVQGDTKRAGLDVQAIFRVDASIVIGSGHVMRCLTLADELKTRGWQCRFICRDHAGNLNALIRQCGFDVDELPGDTAGTSSGGAEHRGGAAHAGWLGCDIDLGARQTLEAVAAVNTDATEERREGNTSAKRCCY